MTRRAGLGRGLDALLPVPEQVEGESAPNEVAINDIVPNPRQPRQRFDDDAIEGLAASIRQLGILQPLLVRPRPDGRFELVAGERRLRAARLAELERVPVMSVDTDDRGSLERALVENLHRENLNPIEEAEGYRQLLDEAGLTQESLAGRLGRSRVTITNALRLLELPDPVKRLLVEGRITAAHGRALLVLQDNPFQMRLATRVAREGLSVRETEDHVRRYQTMVPSRRASGNGSTRPEVAREAQRALADYLQTRVRVDVGKKKGRIVVDFATLEELERLYDVITGESAGARPSTASPG